MDKQYLNDEFDHFFEFPTEDKSHVLSVSAKLFAEHIAYPLEEYVAELEAKLEKYQNLEPVAKDWTVFNSGGAEVWSGLSLSDAAIELTNERLDRGWCAVCVLNKENLPLYALEK